MKRFLSMLFVLCMCLGCLGGMAVHAEGGAQVKASVVSGFVGDEVTVQISVENNPGIAYLKVKLGYDPQVLSLESAQDHALLGGATFKDENPYIFVWSQAGNCTVDGVLATVTFAIDDEAALGDSPLTVTIEEATNEDKVNITGSFTAVDGSVTVKEAVSTITSSSISLGESIALNYYVELCPQDVGAKMEFTINGNTYGAEGTWVEGSEYCYTLYDIAPQCMGDVVSARLVRNFGDAEALAEKESFSVRENVLALLGMSAAELGYTNQQYAAMKTLIADLLEYGAAAQQYKNHATASLVNAGVEGASQFVAPESLKKAGTAKDETLKITSVGVWFDYVNSVYVKFVADSGVWDNENCRISLKIGSGEEVFYTLSHCETLSDGVYMLQLGALYPTEFEDKLLIKVGEYDADLEDFTAKHSVAYSVNSFVASMYNNENVKIANLAKTLYNYGVSAVAFADSFNA